MAYWLVGAFLGGYDMTDIFVHQKSWILSYTIEEPGKAAVEANEKVRLMQPGDGIAIKSIAGATGLMTIKALGIAVGDGAHQGPHSNLEQAFYDNGKLIGTRQRIYVDWRARFRRQTRQVPLEGKMKSVHGPFTLEEHRAFVNNIFRLV